MRIFSYTNILTLFLQNYIMQYLIDYLFKICIYLQYDIFLSFGILKYYFEIFFN